MGCGSSNVAIIPEREKREEICAEANDVTPATSHAPIPTDSHNTTGEHSALPSPLNAIALNANNTNLQNKDERADPMGSLVAQCDADASMKKDRSRHSLSTSKQGPSACGSERSIPGSYLTDEEAETIKDWLKNVVAEPPAPIEEVVIQNTELPPPIQTVSS